MDLTEVNRIYLNRNMPSRNVSALKRKLEAHRNNVSEAQRIAQGAGGRRKIDRDSKLFKVCQEFESIFIKQMLNSMRKTINKSGLLDGGVAEEIFEDMLYDKYALKMSQSARFGISDLLYRELAK